MDDIMKEYKELFLEEAEEYIIALNDSLIALEKEKNSRELIDNIFRVAHTIKSSAAAVGYNDLSKLSHKAEDLMQQIRSGEKIVTTPIVDALFEVFDIIKEYVECVKNDEKIEIDIDGMIKKLVNIISKSNIKDIKSSKKKKKDKTANEKQKEISIELNEYEQKLIEQAEKQGNETYLLNIEVDPREQLKWLRAELLINNIKKISEIVKIMPDKEEFISNDFNGLFSVIIVTKEDQDNISNKIRIDLIKDIIVKPFKIADAVNKKEGKKSGQSKKKGKANKIEDKKSMEKEQEIQTGNETEEQPPLGPGGENDKKHQITGSGDTIRVPVKKLDELMHLIGELVITNSGLKILEQKVADLYKDNIISSDMSSVTDKLINISSELQNSIMKTRMLPISNIFVQFSRIIRDIAKDEKKEIELIINGADTELDKKLIDLIGDPLMHLVRNSVDHGIEHPADRIKKGKAPKGTIILSASQSGNHILLSIKDNGKGIDVDKIKEKAVSKGFSTKSALNEMDEKQILNFIFEPGFSTSDKVSTVSGRGVGLDVVKTVVGKLSGTVEVETEVGKGTEFIITLPLTLAITSVIMINSNNNTYAIPISDIEETIKVKMQDIQSIQGVKAIKLRNTILPLVNLNNVFENKSNIGDIGNLDDNKSLSVVVAVYRKRKLGLIVDRVIGKQEIVLKSLEEHYQVIEGLSGAAILGDGKIILVVDILGVLNLIRKLEKEIEEVIGDNTGEIPSPTTDESKKEKKKSKIKGKKDGIKKK